jgi:glycosyltransferase involved in cell wall biosynthesis
MVMKTEKSSDKGSEIIVVFPVFNDWKVAQVLLNSLDDVFFANGLKADVLAIDDGSTISFADEINSGKTYRAINRIDVLELGRNLGHQRAITVALSYIEENRPCETVVVMDADGEDDPKYIPALLEKSRNEQGKKIIFADRTKRSEGIAFRFFYGIYKLFYKIFTGSRIRVGNFCVIPYNILHKVVLLSEIWNHFSAGILRSRIPYIEIPTERGRRLAGRSKMNFTSLIQHGLSAISVHADTLGIRALLATALVMVTAIAAIIVVVGIKLLTNLAIPGWASTLALLFFLVFMQTLSVSLFFIFLILNGRNNLGFLPKRDCRHFVRGVHNIFSSI